MEKLKSDLRGIETFLEGETEAQASALKSDLRGIETPLCFQYSKPPFQLKSDLRGIETYEIQSTAASLLLVKIRP